MSTLTLPDPLVAAENAREARAVRFQRRFHGRLLTRLPRVAKCGRYHNGSLDGGVVVRKGETGAFFSGVQTCASVWACAVCQAKIGQRRALEVRDGVTRWLAAGNVAHFVTFTIPHSRIVDENGEAQLVPLADSFADVAACFKRMLQGRSWRHLRRTFGVEGYLRTLEATYGEANGWHPHIHAVVFTGPLSDDKRDALYRALWSRWEAVLLRDCGLVASRGAFDAEPVCSGDGLGRYLMKLGLELFRHDLKEGRRSDRFTPWQILDAASDGEAWAINRWSEWETVTKGRRCMTWSRGLRKLLGLVDVDPEQLLLDHSAGSHDADPVDACEACERQPGLIVAVIDPRTWYGITLLRGADHQLLDLVERDGSREQLDLLLATVRQRT